MRWSIEIRAHRKPRVTARSIKAVLRALDGRPAPVFVVGGEAGDWLDMGVFAVEEAPRAAVHFIVDAGREITPDTLDRLARSPDTALDGVRVIRAPEPVRVRRAA